MLRCGKSSDLHKRQSGFLQQTLGVADLSVHLLYRQTRSQGLYHSETHINDTCRSNAAGRTGLRLPSWRLDCLLIRLDRDPTTEFLFLNLQRV